MRLIDAERLKREIEIDRIYVNGYSDSAESPYQYIINLIDEMPGVMQWVSVDTELPPDGRILVASKGGKVHIGTVTLTDGNDMFCSVEHNQQPLLHKVAHWMPLPPPPEK